MRRMAIQRAGVTRHGDGGKRQTANRVDGKLLAEPQTAGRLRSMGWDIPAAVKEEYMLRVYDTRLDDQWLRALGAELGGAEAETFVIGGDFLTQPHLEDAAAFRAPPIKRWGPDGSGVYQLLVPPRPHLASWLQRCRHQMEVESPQAWFTVCATRYVPKCSGCDFNSEIGSASRILAARCRH